MLLSSFTSPTILFQNQCSLHTLVICSMGIFLVSGNKKYTNAVITITHPPKKKKIPDLKWQSMGRKVWAVIKMKRKLTATVILCPADRISNGKISLGTNHASGPHDHAKPDTYMQIKIIIKVAYPLLIPPWSPSWAAISPPIIICERNIWTPPMINKALRPSLSTISMDVMVETAATALITTAEKSDALSAKPIVRKSTGAQKEMTFIPVTCWKNGIAIAITSWGLYFLCKIILNGCLMVFDMELALMRSSNSACTSLVPRTRCSINLAFSWSLLFWIRLLGVSGRNTAPSVRIEAGAAAMAREIRQPQPPLIFSVPKFIRFANSIPKPTQTSKPMLTAPL